MVLGALALTLVTIPLPSFAEQGEAREQITVTGTRIGRSNLDGYPVEVITADQLKLTESTTLDELLRDMPSVTLQGINKNNNNGGLGLAFVDLRNLGVQRTLVLVNGRRFVVGSSGVSEAVDLNNIPVSMVERVEILQDGASAVYGSDAVAGVINIILKDDFEGLQLDGFAGVSDEGDGETLSLSATMGMSSDRGNVTFNLTYLNRDKIRQANRGWAAKPVVFEDIAGDLGQPVGQLAQLIASSSTPFGRASLPGVGTVNFEPDAIGAGTGLSYTPFGDYPDPNDVAPAGPRFNYGVPSWLVGETERISLSMNGHYDILDDVEFFMEGNFTKYEGVQVLAPQPIGLSGTSNFGDATGFNPGGVRIPLNNGSIPTDYLNALLALDLEGGGPDGDQPDGILDFDINTDSVPGFARRMSQIGNRITTVDSLTFRVVTGFQGKLSMFEPLEGSLIGDYDWNLYVDWGQSRATNSMENAVSLARVNIAADPALCGNKIGKAIGCPQGPDADFFGDTGLTKEVQDFIRFNDREQRGFDELVVGIDISGEVVELPAGPLGFALGYEHRDEEGFNEPNAVNVGGESSGNGQEPTAGGYKVDELFFELTIPILADLPGVDDLSVDFAFRYTDYDTFGSDENYRARVSYAPVDFLRFRGGFNTVFRAPSISDLFGGAADSFETLTDPCNNWNTSVSIDPVTKANCQNGGAGILAVPTGFNQNDAGGSQIRTNIGGNPNLKAETADIWNAGVVLRPTFLEEYIGTFSATLDYYHIEIEQAIDSPNPQSILNSCYRSVGLSDPGCSNVTRVSNGSVDPLIANAENLNRLEVQGIDFAIDWGFDLDTFGLPGIGRLDLSVRANHVLEDKEFGPSGVTDNKGTLQSNNGVIPDWRVTTQGTFSRDNWSITNTVRFIDEAKLPELEGSPTTKVHDVVYWDLAAKYDWNGWTFLAGMDNVLDIDPPFFPEGGQNASPESYDFVGRFLWTRVSYKF